MIFKASRVSSAGHVPKLAAHLLRTDENEHVGAIEYRNTAARTRLSDGLETMFRTRELTGSKMGLYQVSINPRDDEGAALSPEQWRESLDELEKRFNLTNQPRILVPHVKNGRLHVHAVYQVADTDRGRKCHSFSHDHHICRDVGNELAERFKLREISRAPSGQAYTRDEQQQAKREGYTVPERKAAIREAWSNTRTGAEFRQELQRMGFDIATGDRASLVIVSQTGTPIRLSSELRGTASARDVQARFKGQELEPFAVVANRQKERAREERRTGKAKDRTIPPKEPVQARADRLGRTIEESIEAVQAVREHRAQEAAKAQFREQAPALTQADRAPQRAQQFADNEAAITQEKDPAPDPGKAQARTHEATGRTLDDSTEAAQKVLNQRAQEEVKARFREGAPVHIVPTNPPPAPPEPARDTEHDYGGLTPLTPEERAAWIERAGGEIDRSQGRGFEHDMD